MDPNLNSALRSGTLATEKSSQLLIREYPHRAIAIVASSHALIFRYSPTTGEAIADGSLASVSSARPRGDALVSKCMVEFSPATDELLKDYRTLTPRPIYGTLGLISLGQDVFLCVITQASRVASLRPGETVERIDGVEFFCLNSAEYDSVFALNPMDLESDTPSTHGQNLARREGEIEYPYHELLKLLSNQSFYYSTDFDLTNRLQDRKVDSESFDIDNFDESFLWNSFMIGPLVEFRSNLLANEREILDASRILTSAIRGFCATMPIPQSAAPLSASNTGLPSFLTVISRLSCKRAGTRFNSRGIDDDGNVANFVETETIYWSPSGVLFSYAQVRGSVPVFWEQAAGLIPGQQKITVTRSVDGTQPAFNKHFEDLEQAYGAVHIINLLSEAKPGEAELSQLFRRGVQHCSINRRHDKNSRDHVLLQETDFDFHAETKTIGYDAAKEIQRYIEHSAEGFAYFLAEETDDSAEMPDEKGSRRLIVVLQQEGVFRTNCLDCLDRTNLIQTLVSRMAAESFLHHRGENASSDFWIRHSTLWADNGDALSRIYAGTGALKSSFTRTGKMSLAGAFADARKSATRLYINNFADKSRQTTIDQLLGRLVGQSVVHLFDPISDYAAAELSKRSPEFSSTENITIWAGTYNLNGRSSALDADLTPWLCPESLGTSQPHIFVVAFQEIVELNPQQIMNSDPTRKQEWENAVRKTLNDRAKRIGGDKYILLRSGQLVGAALCIFVRASVLSKIKNVEGNVKKTGMSGMAGNKGAVAIRMDYANTQICFVTAHLAAGFANYEERNKDYATIHHGLRFQRDRGIDNHDTIIWLGDFNYRIGLSYDNVMNLINQRNIEFMYDNDQLNIQMVAGLAFPYYSEAKITFMPTYKFDVGTDRYDSSEKQRIPAWTDRILRRGTNIRQTAYNSAPLQFSDHRPVYATFQCTVSIIDEPLKEKITRQLYERRKQEIGHATANLDVEDSEDEDLIGYDAIEPGLPPASSDRQRWWLDNGKMAASAAAPPKAGNGGNSTMVLNPNRPSNPFTPTEEPDWVAVPRGGSRLSSFSSSMSSSPYEHVNHSTLFSTSASSSMPRKALPSNDASVLPAKFGRINLIDNDSPGDETPPPPPPRGQSSAMPSLLDAPLVPLQVSGGIKSAEAPPRPVSVASQASNKSKGPPPIARKPVHLTSTSPTDGSSSSDTGTRDSTTPTSYAQPIMAKKPSNGVQSLMSKLESSGSGSLTGGMHRAMTNPVSSQRSAAQSAAFGYGGPASASGVSLPGLGEAARPKLPSRPPATSAQQLPKPARRSTTVDLLGDDDSSEMRGWDTLKPT